MSGNYYTPYSLRISEELHGKLKQLLEENKRSENSEIECIPELYMKTYEKEDGSIEYDFE